MSAILFREYDAFAHLLQAVSSGDALTFHEIPAYCERYVFDALLQRENMKNSTKHLIG